MRHPRANLRSWTRTALAWGLLAAAGLTLAWSARAAAAAQPTVPWAGTQEVEPVGGYGPWRFGMSEAEVSAIEANAPYEPVRASMGGLETLSGLAAELERVSFVFNSADQLYLIRVWYDQGEDYDGVLTALHRAYVDLTDEFGAARVDTGFPLKPGMGYDEFASLVPDEYAPTGEEFDMEADDHPDQFRMQPVVLRIFPLTRPPDTNVLVMFAKLHPTTSYLVQVVYQGTAFVE